MLIDSTEYRCISTLADKRVEHISPGQRSADQWQRTCLAKQVAIPIVISTVNQIGAASHASSSSWATPMDTYLAWAPFGEIGDPCLWVMKLPAAPMSAPTPDRRVLPASCPASQARSLYCARHLALLERMMLLVRKRPGPLRGELARRGRDPYCSRQGYSLHLRPMHDQRPARLLDLGLIRAAGFPCCTRLRSARHRMPGHDCRTPARDRTFALQPTHLLYCTISQPRLGQE